jgi:hypothetical protein
MTIIIAHKCHSAGIVYVLATFLCVGILASVLGSDVPTSLSIYYLLIGAIPTVLSAIYAIRYLSLPSDIIVLTEDNMLILPKNVAVPLNTVVDVSYKRAQAKGIQYKWGKIILQTRDHTYKFDFVADCEDVSKHLTRQMYAAKHTDT